MAKTQGKPTHRDTLLQEMDKEQAGEAVAEVTQQEPEQVTAPEPVRPTTPEPAPKPAVGTQPPADETPGFLDQLSQLGFKDVPDEAAAHQRVIEAYTQQQHELEELRKERERLANLADYGTKYLGELKQKQQEEQAPAQTARQPEFLEVYQRYMNAPKIDLSRVQQYREQDPASGAFQWKKGTPADVMSSATTYEEWLRQWQDDIALRPQEVLPPIVMGVLHERKDDIKQLLAPIIEEMYQEMNGVQTEAQFLAQVEHDNAEWLYVKDPRTNEFTSKLTPEGEQIVTYLQELSGVPDIRTRWQYAKTMLSDRLAEGGRTVERAQEQAEKTAAQKRREHIQRTAKATASPSRGGSVPRQDSGQPPARQNANLSPGRELVQQLEADGVTTL